ncbi:isopropanol dehydrogenase [Glonium stellatum]|uniref:Isopropanol dehydrogenase n=1 Tax=Glonium stellatum TaxID=574774 RepID=A0A8E2JTC8_9PEZI|nr:isopropanol dehydrogenase [Glonium stellatum]
MAQHKALVLSSHTELPKLTTVPTPEVQPGQAIVRILAVRISKDTRGLITGKVPFPLSFPLTPGSCAIGRVAAVGPDAVSLKPGQLVYLDHFIKARDDPSINILMGMCGGQPGTPAAKLMDGEWRNGYFAQYAKVPLENAFPLDEQLLISDLGYSIPDLISLCSLVLTLSGLSEINVQPGETVIVAPATGGFSGMGVAMALALGARVIAVSRNETALKELKNFHGKTGRFTSVVLKGDVEADTKAIKDASPQGKGSQAYIDWSPPAAALSTHITSCILALGAGGRAVFMGAIFSNVSIPYSYVMYNNIQIKGRYMSERHSFEQLIRMIESGIMPLGEKLGVKVAGEFGLDQFGQAMTTAEQNPGWSRIVVLTP